MLPLWRMDRFANNGLTFGMKKLLKYLLIFAIVIIGLFLLGPRPDDTINMNFDATAIPDDMETYLSKQEAVVPNIVKGTEKEIIWADPASKLKTEHAIIYIHGFSATKHEIRPVPDNVAKALGANLYFARLQGHGRDGPAMAEASIGGWMDDFNEAIAIGKRLGDKVIIVATSNGAPISTWGLQGLQDDPSIMGLATISANFELQGISTTLANIPWAETILPALSGNEYSWEPNNELHGKWWTHSYPSKAIFSMTTLLKLLKDFDKNTIKTPALFIYSPDDLVVKPSAIEDVISQWGGPTEVMKISEASDPYNHVIAGDILSPENTATVTDAIIKWANGL